MRNRRRFNRILSVEKLEERLTLTSFSGLGELPGGKFTSSALAVSSDRSTIVGETSSELSGASRTEAFRWSSESGIEGIGRLPGADPHSSAWGVSGDGKVIVGEAATPEPGTGFRIEAFRWTQTTGMVGLGDLDGGNFQSSAKAVSEDGSIIVGFGSSEAGTEAFRWSEEAGMLGLGDFDSNFFKSIAYDISADGTVIAGVGHSTNGMEAFRWTASTGMVGLGDLPGRAFQSEALAISHDGSVVVGWSTSDQGTGVGEEAFRWEDGTGMVGLGFLPGGNASVAYGVSGDGSIVVGQSTSRDGYKAFVWDAQNGMRSLEDVLESEGAHLIGWELTSAFDVSNDGTTIVGVGDSPGGTDVTEAWMGQLRTEPNPPILSVDQSIRTTEDMAATLGINARFSSQNGGDRLAVEVAGIPTGATLSDDVNRHTGGGSVDISNWDLSKTKVTPPAHDDAEFQLAITATSESASNAPREASGTLHYDFETGLPSHFSVFDSSLRGPVSRALGSDALPNRLWMVQERDKALHISKQADDGEFYSDLSIHSGVISNFQIDGDFSVTVDFSLHDFPATSERRFHEALFAIVTGTDEIWGDRQFGVKRARVGLDDSIQSFSTVPTTGSGFRQSDLTEGQFRISRVAREITAWFAPAGKETFTRLASEQGLSQPVHIQMFAAQGSHTGRNRSHSFLDVGFDNLVIEADTILAPAPLSSQTVARVDVHVDAVADTPQLLVSSPVFGVNDNPMQLLIDGSLVDSDGSETLQIVLGGIPDGFTMSNAAGDSLVISAGQTTLTPSETEGLVITTPTVGTFTLSVSAVATEANPTSDDKSVSVNIATVESNIEMTVEEALVVTDSHGLEDTAIPIAITLAKALAGEPIIISQVPIGAALSAGTKGSESVWVLNAEQLQNLTVTPPLHDDGEFSLAVAISDFQAEIAVRVDAVADHPTLTVNERISTDEDTAVDLGINVGVLDNDGSETLAIVISELPEGVIVTDGTERFSDGGSIEVSDWQISSLRVLPATHNDGDFRIKVTATSTEENPTSSNREVAVPASVTFAMIEVYVDAVADPPEVVAPDRIVTDEDTAADLGITASLVDIDGSETLRILISGIPAGVTLTDGSAQLSDSGEVDVSSWNVEAIKVIPASHDDTDFQLTISATSTEEHPTSCDTGVAVRSASSVAIIQVQVEAVADSPKLLVSDNSTGFEGMPMPVFLEAMLVDTDGSETLEIELNGIPAESTITNAAGDSFGVSEGGVTLTAAQTAGLTITVWDEEVFTLEVTASTTEKAMRSTASTSGQIHVSIENLPPIVESFASNAAAGSRVSLGQLLEISISFIDHGVFDTNSIAVDWGDGTSSALNPAEQSKEVFVLFHYYRQVGDFDAKLILADDDGAASVVEFTTTIVPRWQNAGSRFDTNNDGVITSNDVLLIVNRLNTSGPGELIVGQHPVPLESPFYDVNGDGFSTANDALQTINFLNQRDSSNSLVSEGEYTRLAEQPAIKPGLPRKAYWWEASQHVELIVGLHSIPCKYKRTFRDEFRLPDGILFQCSGFENAPP